VSTMRAQSTIKKCVLISARAAMHDGDSQEQKKPKNISQQQEEILPSKVGARLLFSFENTTTSSGGRSQAMSYSAVRLAGDVILRRATSR
jgi:hypothetical protein